MGVCRGETGKGDNIYNLRGKKTTVQDSSELQFLILLPSSCFSVYELGKPMVEGAF